VERSLHADRFEGKLNRKALALAMGGMMRLFERYRGSVQANDLWLQISREKTMNKSLPLVLLLAVTSVCDAAGWTAPMTVTSAFTETDDLIVISTNDATVYTPGCAAGLFIFSTASTDAQRARASATIMTALATGQKVSLWYGDSCTTWNDHLTTSVKLNSE
jgi:hypothetical protein